MTYRFDKERFQRDIRRFRRGSFREPSQPQPQPQPQPVTVRVLSAGTPPPAPAMDMSSPQLWEAFGDLVYREETGWTQEQEARAEQEQCMAAWSQLQLAMWLSSSPENDR